MSDKHAVSLGGHANPATESRRLSTCLRRSFLPVGAASSPPSGSPRAYVADVESMIPCVLYAAKSSEDVRGSLGTQIEDCRRVVAEFGGRQIAAEYADEAASGALQPAT